jgi:tRNA A-37 threonylcarbamoyl transferase component Bud32
VAVTTDILPPRYRSPERIGRGGMGDIYLATDSVLVRKVAIKILADRYAQDQSVRQRFTREALAAARLSGEPNIVTIFDVGEYRGGPYIVMEHLGGGSLEDVLRRDGAQPPQQVFAWLDEAGRALDAAHARGVVHRDIKPGNLMLDTEGHIHVADFGIASAAGTDSLTMTGTVLGTAGYLSPEQAQGERATSASDRYALGVVAFELLTGRRPFEADSPTAEAAAQVNAPVPSVARMAGFPGEVDPVFAQALAKDPQRRFTTAGEFVAALRDAFAEAAGPTRAFAVAPPVRDARSRPWPLLVGLLAVGAIAGALFAYFLTRGDHHPAPTRVVTRVHTVTTSAAAATPSGRSGEALNDAGYAKMQAGDFPGALPLLEEAVRKLDGTGKLYEAYAKYNLAYTRFQLGNCDGVLDLLDQAEVIEGHKGPIDELRKRARNGC